jgi:hypothetical protein
MKDNAKKVRRRHLSSRRLLTEFHYPDIERWLYTVEQDHLVGIGSHCRSRENKLHLMKSPDEISKKKKNELFWDW